MTDERRLIKVKGERLGHIPSFDGFRGIFVLQVVLYHAGVTSKLFPGSPIIIDWFFVASGFLITSLLLDEKARSGSIDMRRFYTRRALRLFPAMYFMIAVFTVLMLIIHFVAPDALENAGLWWLESLAASLYVYFLVAAFFPGTIGAIGPHVEPHGGGAVLLLLAHDPAAEPEEGDAALGPEPDHRLQSCSSPCSWRSA